MKATHAKLRDHLPLLNNVRYRNKKIKPFKDGFAVLDPSTRRVSLLDEFKKPIDGVYMRSLDALDEDLELEMERHFCVVAAPAADAAVACLVTTVESSTAPAIRRPPIPKRAFHAAFKAPSMLAKKPTVSSRESIVPPKVHQPLLEKRAERGHVPNVSKWSLFNEDEESKDETIENACPVEEALEQLSDRSAPSHLDSTDQTVFSVQMPGKIPHRWKPPKPAFSYSALSTTAAWNTADSGVNRSIAADDAGPIQSSSNPEDLYERNDYENSSKTSPRPNSPAKNFKGASKADSIVPKFAAFKPPSSKGISAPSTVANYKGKPTQTSRIPSKSSTFSRHIVTSPPIVQIPKHSSENLYFRTSSQTQGLKKSFLKRNFIIPRSFVDPRSYTACFKSAIIEHLQLQLDSLAIRFHTSVPQQHQKQQKPVQGSRYMPRPPPIYTATLSRSLPSLAQKHAQRGSPLDGNLILNFELSSKPHSTQQSKHDLWIVGDSPSFDSGNVFMGISVFYGGGFGGASVEVKPFSRADDARAAGLLGGRGDREVYVLYGMNVMMEMLMLENLERILGIGDGDSNGNDALDERNEELRLLGGLLGPDAHPDQASEICSDSTEAHQAQDGETAFEQVMQLVNDVKSEFTLNQDQAKVVEEVALSVCVTELKSSGNVNGFRLVHGVFGSGKTYLIAVVVILLQRAVDLDLLAHTPDFRIAISSMSNGMNSEPRTFVFRAMPYMKDFVRIGSLKKIAKPLLPYTLQQLKNSNEDLKELRAMLKSDSLNAAAQKGVQEAMRRFTKNENKNLLETAFVIGVTCAACSFEVLEGFEATLLVLDECSQMTEPLSLLPISRFNPSHAVLIGDPLQLSPTLETNCVTAQTSLERTLYERLASLGTPSTLLRTQYRCHPRIAQIPNRLFYGGILLHGMNLDKDEENGPYSACVGQLGPACFVDVRGAGGEKKGSGPGGSLVNFEEAEFVVKMVAGLVNQSISCEQIGVITYYKSQVALIQNRISADANLSGILVSTVDSFQGGERDVILISTVRSEEYSFIDEPKRVNVSLTRARKHLVIIGNGLLLSRSPVWREIVGDCDQFSEKEILEYLNLDVGPSSSPLDLDLQNQTSTTTKDQEGSGSIVAFGNWNREPIDSEICNEIPSGTIPEFMTLPLDLNASNEILHDTSTEVWRQLQQEGKQLSAVASDSWTLDGKQREVLKQDDDVDDVFGYLDTVESNEHTTGEHADSWAAFADQIDELAFDV
ncbi:hypothetical protein HDU81_003767 [Chytriomyces hyalinus]|nr:hypothetical protein HDU81_003767 [Chytriomyces hyalinus]